MIVISELLGKGIESARTARELTRAAGLDPSRNSERVITLAIERERRNGSPICASTDPKHPGYYLPESADELQNYLNRLGSRQKEIGRTLDAMRNTLTRIRDADEQCKRNE